MAYSRPRAAIDVITWPRYAGSMQTARILLGLFGALITASISAAPSTNAPVVAVLEYSGGIFAKRAPIRASHSTVKSPYPKLAQSTWTLRAGDTLQQEFAPRGRVIQFWRSAGTTPPQPVCSVVVRYVRDGQNWRPVYLLQQPAAGIWNGNQVVPPSAPPNKHDLVQLINRDDANSEGFYKTLKFGMTKGLGRIDTWTVH